MCTEKVFHELQPIVGPFSLPAEALIEIATAKKNNRICLIVTVNYYSCIVLRLQS